ncbi:hypothetical protein N9T46_01270 [bacterium]|nr:hypothetical protein [bacterium]
MTKNILSKVGAITAAMLFYSIELQALETCFSFIPYASNSSFVQLPENKKFCFHFSNEKTHMSTNDLGGRVIKRGFLPNEIIAFGESQLLGLDLSDLKTKVRHDLSVLFPSSSITIYAAPNNGPLQALQQIKKVHSFKSLANKNIVVGFNFGTDIFRIQDHWNPENFVPLNMTQLSRSFSIPGYHDIILFVARLRGVKFGGTESNSKLIRRLYFQMGEDRRRQNIDNWLLKLSNSEIKQGKKRYFILYPPYWYVGAGEKEKNDIENDYFELACKTHNSRIFEEIWVTRMPKETVKFALDNRHYLSGEMTFEKYNC